MKLIYALAIAMCCATGANAELKCMPEYLVTDGYFIHGSAECNMAWLDRKASVDTAEFAKSCRNMKYKDAEKYILEGMHHFDDSSKKLGRDAACKKLDEAMQYVEGN